MIMNGNFFRKVKANFSSFEDVKLFINVFILLTVIPVLIKLFSLPKLMNLLTPNDIKKYKNLSAEKLTEKVVKFTDYILGCNFWIYNPKCLKRSIVLYHYLRKAGIDVHICFGVRINDEVTDPLSVDKLEGHAWLEYKGEIFLEKDAEMAKTYKMTYCFPQKNNQGLDTVFYQS